MFLKRSYSVRDVDSNFVRVETDPKLKQILKGYMFKSQTLLGRSQDLNEREVKV